MEVLGPYEGNPIRIDIWLTKQLPYSRNFFHHIIQRGGVKVMKKQNDIGNIGSTLEINKKDFCVPVKKSYLLQPGDMVCIDDITRHLSSTILEEAPPISIPIVYETDDYCVIDKPKGILSHPTSIWEVKQPSVVGFLYHYYKSKSLPSLGNFIRSGLLHRLDKDTDGFLLVAKTEFGLRYFKSLFQQKSLANTLEEKEKIPLIKRYTAYCYNTKEGQEFLATISSFPHVIIKEVRAKVPHYTPKLGITKILSWSVVPQNEADRFGIPNVSIVKVNLEILTGRTHQIRYHLASFGLPIVGDCLYNNFFYQSKNKKQTPICLSATYLAFCDCYGENKVFEKTFSCIL